MECRNGYNSKVMHDETNKYAVDHLQSCYNGVTLEERVVNDDGSRKQPDIIFNNKILWKDG